MSARPRKRRSPGEGGCWPYMTTQGGRWRARGVLPGSQREAADLFAKLIREAGA